MNNYYLTLVLKPDLDEKTKKEILGLVKGKVDEWGSRDLAYPIKKQTKGYYIHFEFESDPKAIKDLDKSLKVEENIIRYLLVRRFN